MKRVNRRNKLKFLLHVIFVGVLILLQIASLGGAHVVAEQIGSAETSTFSSKESKREREPTDKSAVADKKNPSTLNTKEQDNGTSSNKSKKEAATNKEDDAKETEEKKEKEPSGDADRAPDEEESKEKKSSGRTKRSIQPYSDAAFVKEVSGSAGTKYHLFADMTATLVYGGAVTGTYKMFGTFQDGADIYRITRIGERAFSHASDGRKNQLLTGIDFSRAVHLEEIGREAFFQCEKINSKLDFTNCTNLKVIDYSAFRECVSIYGLEFGPDSTLHTIGGAAFRYCTKLGGTPIIIPDSVRNIANEAFMNWNAPKYSRLEHKTVLEMDGSLPRLDSTPPPLPDEINEYESIVDSSDNKTTLSKAAKWLDEDRTTAEIRIDYGSSFERQAKLDVIFVLDQSSSMQIPAPAVGSTDGESYNYPRLFLTNDVVNGATKILLGSNNPNYDNRVALTAFGGEEQYLYYTNYSNSVAGIKEFLYKNPGVAPTLTNYTAGLKGALEIIRLYPDPTRIPVVIFISDGLPEGTGDIYGLNQARTLRNNGHRVYPISIYSSGNMEERMRNLKNISYDGDTAYLAKDSAAFEKIMADVLKDVVNSAVPLEIKLEDVLSQHFELADENTDISISEDGGKAKVTGNKIVWDLNGCEQSKLHTLKLKVRLKPGTELTKNGVLPTNDSLRAADNSIVTTSQPELDRYLAHHEFENESFPGKDLPDEVKALLPGTKGGFADEVVVPVTEPAETVVETEEGQWWEFVGWDETNKTIAGADVTFVGKWKYVGYNLSFIKRTPTGSGLAGVEFSLYKWTGSGVPSAGDLANSNTIASGKWRFIEMQTSQSNGRVNFKVPYEKNAYYQLAETKTLDSYRRPDGQWRFTFDDDGFIKDQTFERIKGVSGELPPPFEIINEGEFTGFFGVVNQIQKGELPKTGGNPSFLITFGTMICLITGAVGSFAWYFMIRRKR